MTTVGSISSHDTINRSPNIFFYTQKTLHNRSSKSLLVSKPNHSQPPNQIILSLQTKSLSVSKPNHSQFLAIPPCFGTFPAAATATFEAPTTSPTDKPTIRSAIVRHQTRPHTHFLGLPNSISSRSSTGTSSRHSGCASSNQFAPTYP